MAAGDQEPTVEEQLAECQISLGLCSQYLAEAVRLLTEARAELARLATPPPSGPGRRAPNN